MSSSPPRDPRKKRSCSPVHAVSTTIVVEREPEFPANPVERVLEVNPPPVVPPPRDSNVLGARPREPRVIPAAMAVTTSTVQPSAEMPADRPEVSPPVPQVDLDAEEHEVTFQAALAEAESRKRKRKNRPSQRSRRAAAIARDDPPPPFRDPTPPDRSSSARRQPLMASAVAAGSQAGTSADNESRAAVRPATLSSGGPAEIPKDSTGSRARRTVAARRQQEADLPPREPPTTSQYVAGTRVGEADLVNAMPVPTIPALTREERQQRDAQGPAYIDLEQQNRHGMPWRLLRADRQEVKILYYDLERLVMDLSDTVTLTFLDLDIFLIHLYCRVCRSDWACPDTDTYVHRGLTRDLYLSWLAWYEQEVKRKQVVMAYTPEEQRQSFQKQRDFEKVSASWRLWEELAYVAACQYVLRRAIHAQPFRELLLRLPSSRATQLTALSPVLGDRYTSVLREVAARLRQGCQYPAGGLPRDLLLGDSHIAPMNFRSVEGHFVPGSVAHFRVMGFSGIDIRALSWVTQAVVGPGTRWLAWVVGANNMELTPIPTKDDRTKEERRMAPRRLDKKGRIIPSWFANVPFEMVYYARLLRGTLPYIQDMFLAKVPARYDHLGDQRMVRSWWDQLPQHPTNVTILRANLLLSNLLAQELHFHVLQIYDRLNDPDYYWRGRGYNQHPNVSQLSYRLYELLNALYTHGVEACQRLQGYAYPGDVPDP